MSSPETGHGPSGDQTFLFADLSGFTALTEAHGDEEAADLITEFQAAVSQLVAGSRAEVVSATPMEVLSRLVPDAPCVPADFYG